jgi:hypothetical protein
MKEWLVYATENAIIVIDALALVLVAIAVRRRPPGSR